MCVHCSHGMVVFCFALVLVVVFTVVIHLSVVTASFVFFTTVSWLCSFLSSAWCITSCILFSFRLLDIIFLDCLYLGKSYFLLQRWQISLPNIVVYVFSHGILKCVAPGSCHSENFYLGINCSSGWFFLICDFCFFSW